jgi:RNA polymerase sigma-70 factor (ECF subfamily)
VPDPANSERFAAMYEQNRSRVYAFAVSKAGRQLADEILSEVFTIAWRKFDTVPDPPLPWLLAVARNVAMSQFRATVREQSVAAEMRAWLSADDPAVGDVAEDVADRIIALTALAELPEADRELLTLVAWHGLAARSAARVIGCSTATFFVRLHRARRRLELALGTAGADRGQGTARESAVAGVKAHLRLGHEQEQERLP